MRTSIDDEDQDGLAAEWDAALGEAEDGDGDQDDLAAEWEADLGGDDGR